MPCHTIYKYEKLAEDASFDVIPKLSLGFSVYETKLISNEQGMTVDACYDKMH
jgi:hypothetical protein